MPKEKPGARPRPSLGRRLGGFIVSWGPVIIIVLLIRAFIVEAFMVPSGSMEDTIRVGDFMLVNKFVYGIRAPFSNRQVIPVQTPRRGDIIVFRCPADPDYPQPEQNFVRFFPKGLPLLPLYWNKLSGRFIWYTPRNFIKRCTAVEGDTLEIRNKHLFINGDSMPDTSTIRTRHNVIAFNEFNRPNIQRRWENMGFIADTTVRDNFGPVVIPPGCVMAMGDNRDNSWDSRFWGPLDLRHMKGKPLVIYFSYAFPPVSSARGPEAEVYNVNLLQVLLRPFAVRLNRIGHLLR